MVAWLFPSDREGLSNCMVQVFCKYWSESESEMAQPHGLSLSSMVNSYIVLLGVPSMVLLEMGNVFLSSHLFHLSLFLFILFIFSVFRGRVYIVIVHLKVWYILPLTPPPPPPRGRKSVPSDCVQVSLTWRNAVAEGDMRLAKICILLEI